LKEALQVMLERQEENLVKFDQDKTELIHFHHRFSEEDQIQVQNLIIKPKRIVKWLGV
jgi:hypothetical protein